MKWQNRVEGAYSAKQTVESEFRKTKRQLEKSTGVLQRIWDLLGQKHRFNDDIDFDMDDLPSAIEEAVEKWSTYRKEAGEKDKKINRLVSQVKDMERHLEREQAESFAMLEELQQAKTAAARELHTDDLLEIVQTLVKMKQEAKLYQEQASYMRAQLTAKDLQVEQERARIDAAVHREREKGFAAELELRRAGVVSQSAKQAEQEAIERARESQLQERKLRLESMATARQRKQKARLQLMHGGSDMSKHHFDKVKTDGRALMLSSDDTVLFYAKDKKSIRKGKKILCKDIRAINFGFATDNLGSRHVEHITTPEWCCFSVVLDARTVDFSCSTEAETAQWVLGLRTLLLWNRQDYRGLEVGAFFWQRAAMKLRIYSIAGSKTRCRYMIDVVKAAGQDWQPQSEL